MTGRAVLPERPATTSACRASARLRNAANGVVALLLVALPAMAATTKTISVPAHEIHVQYERTVSLDVKDEAARDILESMQKQCGIKNLLIDRDVDARGTFLFRSVPCSTAFKVVFQSLGLGATNYGNSVVTVGRNKR